MRRVMTASVLCVVLMFGAAVGAMAETPSETIERLGGATIVQAELEECRDTGEVGLIYAIIDYLWGPKLKEGCRITSFYLPLFRGGYIELLYHYVEETIAINEANGMNTYNADDHLNVAQYYYNNGDYKRAYDRIALAYCVATKVPGENCPR